MPNDDEKTPQLPLGTDPDDPIDTYDTPDGDDSTLAERYPNG